MIWLPEEAQVRVGTDGFIKQVVEPSGSFVLHNEPVLISESPFLQAEAKVLQSQFRELKARYNAYRTTDRVQAQMVKEEMSAVATDLLDARKRLKVLTIHSPGDGHLVVPRERDLTGRFAQQGQTIAYVLNFDEIIVRVAVSQEDVGVVRDRTVGVSVRLPRQLEQIIPGVVTREVPSGAEELPSIVLGGAGGGDIAVDPRDPSGVKVLERVFLFDVTLSDQVKIGNVGGRVYVQFDHGKEPLASQWYRSLRQLFLKRFQV